MNQAFPNWMFAALAIGVFELCDQIARRWSVPTVRYAGGIIAALLLCVVAIRYIVRYVKRDRNEQAPGDDDWKNY